MKDFYVMKMVERTNHDDKTVEAKNNMRYLPPVFWQYCSARKVMTQIPH